MIDLVQRMANRLCPGFVWKVIQKKYRRLSGHSAFFLYSWDCDTDEDAKCAEEVFFQLGKSGFKGIFAVPGVILERYPIVFQRIAQKGGEFINHGYLPHAELSGRHFISTTFYDQMTSAEIEKDIRRGNETIKSILSILPTCFRGPHFGVIRKKSSRKTIYETLQGLHYSISSSTSPRDVLCFPFQTRPCGILEIPVSGSYDDPLTIIDSWSFVKSLSNTHVREEYGIKLFETVRTLKERGFCGFLNFYGDPKHVIQSSSFFEAMKEIARLDVSVLRFSEISDMLRKNV